MIAVMTREPGQRVVAPRPLLEHLRRRLHEIPLGRGARDGLPLPLPSEDGVQQMAELVEEGHHVAVLHEARIARLAAREIADQARFRDLNARDAVPDSEIRRVVVLPRPRVEVQVEPADHPAVLPHLVGLDTRIPDIRVRDLLVGDAE